MGFVDERNVERSNRMIDQFDVDGLARQIASTGAGYYILTIGQNSDYYLSPNKVYDQITGIVPGKCSHRDLVADMAKRICKRSFICHPDSVKIVKYPANKEFQIKWEQIIRAE